MGKHPPHAAATNACVASVAAFASSYVASAVDSTSEEVAVAAAPGVWLVAPVAAAVKLAERTR
jgi:hypothetical protein